MEDVVKRLRDRAEQDDEVGRRMTAGLMREAADEIERLETQVGFLADGVEKMTRAFGERDSRALALAEENAALKLRLERDARTYATMQAGMESQAELGDALKQRCRALEAALRPFAEFARLADELTHRLLDSEQMFSLWDGKRMRDIQSPRMGHCRAAASALAGGG